MIEILLQAERELAAGLVDQAERLYRQAADADPRNSIAVVGLARVALERGDDPEAWRQARRALAIDPENVAAQRLADRLEEVWAYRGESLPDAAAAQLVEVAEVGNAVPISDVAEAAKAAVADPAEADVAEADAAEADPAHASAAPATPGSSARHERSALDRLLRRNRP